MKRTARTVEKVINGRMTVITPRRDCYEVDVYAGPTAVGEPLKEWDMPKVLGLLLAAETAESQTPKDAS